MKLLFCSLSDRPNISKVNYDHLKEYCDKHDYKLVLENKSLDKNRHQSWSKINLIQREMKYNTDYDYIVWIDDDILITDKNKKFEEFINEYPNENVFISEDGEKSYPMNCGVMVCKNNDNTKKYLSYIWNLCETKYPEHKFGPNWEQCVITKDYLETNLMNPNEKPFIKIIPYNTIQTFQRDQPYNNMDWKLGCFSAHFCGMPDEKKISYRNDILKILNKK